MGQVKRLRILELKKAQLSNLELLSNLTKEKEETKQDGDKQSLWFSDFKTLEKIAQIQSSLNEVLLTVGLNLYYLIQWKAEKTIYKCTSTFLGNRLFSTGRQIAQTVTFFNLKSFYLVYSSTWPHSKDNFHRLSCLSDFLLAYYFLSSWEIPALMKICQHKNLRQI